MTAPSSPAPGQRFTATTPEHRCPCGSAELTLISGLVAGVAGVFVCGRGHRGIVRDFAEVTAEASR